MYQGKRVQAWPSGVIKKFDNIRGSKVLRAPSFKEKSHYSAPKGKIYGLTLLVDFSDQQAPVTVEEISDWLNKEGFNRDGCKGSVRDYYLDVSNGQVDFTNEVFGWYRAKHPKSYYEGLKDYTGSDELVKEVFEYFDSEVDFSRYDNDKNGVTEAINIVYAGAGKTWGQGLWPHSGWSNEKRISRMDARCCRERLPRKSRQGSRFSRLGRMSANPKAKPDCRLWLDAEIRLFAKQTMLSDFKGY